MKYCKKCFRNVREDVNRCPYCGAGGLEDYGSSNSGEDFSCSKPFEVEKEIQAEIDSLSSAHSKKDDAYSTEEFSPFDMFNDEEKKEDAYANTDTEEDAYGSKKHTDADCNNAPDNNRSHSLGSFTAVPDPNDPKYQMRIEYLRMLKKIDGISNERIAELMQRYDEMHGHSNTKANSDVRTFTRTYTMGSGNTHSPQTTANEKNTIMSVAVTFFVGLFMPPIGIILLSLIRGQIRKMNLSNQESIMKLINLFTSILVVICAFYAVPILFAIVMGIIYG